MLRPFLFAVLTTVCLTPAARGGEMSDAVAAALERGHGTMCGLDNKPAPRGGYYPCLDIGPYRFVKGYGTLTAYVVLKDAAPFPVFRSGEQGEEFLVRGEWMRDLAPRVAAWWSDEIGGDRGRREAQEGAASRVRDAEREVMRHYPQPAEPPPGAGAAAAAPVTPQPPPSPPAETAGSARTEAGAADLRQLPIPSRLPAAGREIAPGVVQLPAGRPYGR